MSCTTITTLYALYNIVHTNCYFECRPTPLFEPIETCTAHGPFFARLQYTCNYAACHLYTYLSCRRSWSQWWCVASLGERPESHSFVAAPQTTANKCGGGGEDVTIVRTCITTCSVLLQCTYTLGVLIACYTVQLCMPCTWTYIIVVT